MNEALDFIRTAEADKKSIKRFAKLVFEYEIARYGFDFPVSFKLQPNLNTINGYVRVHMLKQKRTATVTLNTLMFLRMAKKDGVPVWFYIYTAIVHELEHLRLIEILESGECTDFNDFAAALCQYNAYTRQNLSGLFDGLIPIPDYSKIKERMTSLPELICTQNGMHRALEVLGDALSDEAKSTVLKMTESIDFLCEHIEITYRNSSQPYNQFAQNMIAMHSRLEKDPSVSDRLKLLNCFFGKDGRPLSPAVLYERAVNEKEGLYKSLLIHMFLLFDTDWTSIFTEYPELFPLIEGLADAYCTQTVEYLKNIHTGEIFLSVDILQDNAAMLIKNTERLNSLMERYDMKRSGGSVFALYR